MRVVLIALLLAVNVLLWSWGQGWLAPVGWPSPEQLKQRANTAHATDTQAKPTSPSPTETTLATSITPNAGADSSTPETPETSETLASTPSSALPASPVDATPTPARPTTATPTQPAQATTSAVADTAADLPVLPDNQPMTNAASLTDPVSTTCWRARTWPVSAKASLQQALLAQPASTLWRIVPHELAQRWVLVLPAGNTSLEQRRALLTQHSVDYRASAHPLPEGYIVGTFVSRDSAIKVLGELQSKGIPVELVQERPATPVWELHVFADTRAQADTVINQVKDLPRYADSPLRVGSCNE